MDYVKLKCARVLAKGSELLMVNQDGLVDVDPWSQIFGDELFVVELTPPGFDAKSPYWTTHYEAVTMSTTAPLELMDNDSSPQGILEWMQRYGVPNPNLGRRSPYVLKDEKEVSPVYNFASVRRMQQHFYDVATAVKIWRWIAEKNVSAIREFIRIERESFIWKFTWENVQSSILKRCSLVLPNDWIAEGEKKASAFETENATTLQCAIIVLADIVNRGLKDYPPTPQVKIDTGSHPTMLKSSSVVGDPMAYIWSVIHEGVCGKKLSNWPYKSCIDCGKWEDISQPGHRNTWTRCEDCTKKYRAAQNTLHKRASREKQREAEGLPKRTRGRRSTKGN
jgi:hypothetical protein